MAERRTLRTQISGVETMHGLPLQKWASHQSEKFHRPQELLLMKGCGTQQTYSQSTPSFSLVINQVPMSFNQGCRGLIPSADLHYLYLYYFLFHSKNLLNSLGTGTTFLELSTSNLKSVKIPLPPLDIQIKKVSWLEETSQELDALTEKVEKKKQLISELRSSFMSKAFDGENNEP
jgi:type I restriction enzyme S subunit